MTWIFFKVPQIKRGATGIIMGGKGVHAEEPQVSRTKASGGQGGFCPDSYISRLFCILCAFWKLLVSHTFGWHTRGQCDPVLEAASEQHNGWEQLQASPKAFTQAAQWGLHTSQDPRVLPGERRAGKGCSSPWACLPLSVLSLGLPHETAFPTRGVHTYLLTEPVEFFSR